MKTNYSISRFSYRNSATSWRVSGLLGSVRIRRNFKTREEAAAEKAALEIKAQQIDSGDQSVSTHLTMVSFWIPKATASPEAVASTQSKHGVFLARLIADKRVGIELLNSDTVPGSAGTLSLNAGSRDDVVAMVLEDPAVKAKMVEFEVQGE